MWMLLYFPVKVGKQIYEASRARGESHREAVLTTTIGSAMFPVLGAAIGVGMSDSPGEHVVGKLIRGGVIGMVAASYLIDIMVAGPAMTQKETDEKNLRFYPRTMARRNERKNSLTNG